MKLGEIRVDKKFEKRLPEPPAKEFEALCESIAENGIIVPLLVSEDGLLLDGHRRFRGAKKLGLQDVPTKVVKCNGARNWGKAFAYVANLDRRHMSDVQKIDIASSLLRIEKRDAEARHTEGVKRGGRPKKGKNKTILSKDSIVNRNKNTAAARTAKRINVSTTAVARVEAVKKADAKLHARTLAGEVNITAAAKQVRQNKIKAEAKKEAKKFDASSSNKVETLEEMAGKCRTVYADPPWSYGDEGCQGAAAAIYPTMTNSELARLPVGELAHKAGCLYWIWTTWPMIRDGTPHELIDTWGLRWVGELVWVKPGLGVGRWLRPATEILILAVKGKPTLLENSGLRAVLEAKKGAHSKKPVEAYEFIERLSPEIRLEMFQRGKPRPSWMRWGLEA